MLKNIEIKGYIYSMSGIRIGGNKDTMQIGGIDSPVVKNPINNIPYIPGSSLKGKTRFLLEHRYDCYNENTGEVSGILSKSRIKDMSWNTNPIALVFGFVKTERKDDSYKTTENSDDTAYYPTRVIFRDSNIVGAILDPSVLEESEIDRDIPNLKLKMGSDFSEAKMEVNINRISGTVNSKSGGPRTIERVPAGTVFDFSVTLRVFREQEAENHKQLLLEGLKLLENDSLGGSGSRGYGRIRFFGLKCVDGEGNETTIEL